MISQTTGNLNNDWVFNKIKELCLLLKNLTILAAVWHSIVYQSIDVIFWLTSVVFSFSPLKQYNSPFFTVLIHMCKRSPRASTYELLLLHRQVKLYQTLSNNSSTQWCCTNLCCCQKCIKSLFFHMLGNIWDSQTSNFTYSAK